MYLGRVEESEIVEDKTFELLTQMYSEMNKKFDVVNKRFDEVDKKLDRKADKADIVRLENEHGKKLDALMDGYQQLAEGQEEIKSQIAELSLKVDKQEIETTGLKAVK